MFWYSSHFENGEKNENTTNNTKNHHFYHKLCINLSEMLRNLSNNDVQTCGGFAVGGIFVVSLFLLIYGARTPMGHSTQKHVNSSDICASNCIQQTCFWFDGEKYGESGCLCTMSNNQTLCGNFLTTTTYTHTTYNHSEYVIVMVVMSMVLLPLCVCCWCLVGEDVRRDDELLHQQQQQQPQQQQQQLHAPVPAVDMVPVHTATVATRTIANSNVNYTAVHLV